MIVGILKAEDYTTFVFVLLIVDPIIENFATLERRFFLCLVKINVAADQFVSRVARDAPVSAFTNTTSNWLDVVQLFYQVNSWCHPILILQGSKRCFA